MRFVAVVTVLASLVACDSNPTPHPGADTIPYDTAVSDAAGGAAEPDRDNNGVGDCTQAGGFWDGEGCEGAVATPDTEGADTVDAAPPGDAPDAPDANEAPDAPDALDGDDDETADASAGDLEDGEVESDAGPDSGE